MPKYPSSHNGQLLHTKPGNQHEMIEQPLVDDSEYKAAGKLKDKVVIITGGDSGIGQAVALACAKEGANIAICYLKESKDADKTKSLVEKYNGLFFGMMGDISNPKFCNKFITKVYKKFKRIDVVINNAAEQFPNKSIEEITHKQLERTFKSNIYSMFYMVQAAIPYLKKGATIINTTSVTAYRGSPHLLDYSSTKGAIVAFTRSLSGQLAEKGIRVNAVAPGPIWTPLIPSTFSRDKVKNFGKDVPLGRAGQPSEVAPAFVFLACRDSSYITGQVVHVNGGEIINS
jgi:NAD(P)-dependent dehydrogenase (short-subunit alcohol dehydrogenase family)